MASCLRGTTILVLSSEPVVRSVIKEMLEGAGYIVLATEDVGNAADALKESTPNLLLLHPYVDGLPGLDAAMYLKTKCPTMHVLMLAGLIDDDRLASQLQLQGVRVFPNPVSATQVLAEVEELVSTPKG